MAVQTSPMEREVLRGLARGLQSKEIAVELNRSRACVEVYVRTLFTKFEARSRAHLVALALMNGTLLPRDILQPRTVPGRPELLCDAV